MTHRDVTQASVFRSWLEKLTFRSLTGHKTIKKVVPSGDLLKNLNSRQLVLLRLIKNIRFMSQVRRKITTDYTSPSIPSCGSQTELERFT